MTSLRVDGPVDLIFPFEELGRRIVRSWSPDHVSAALPGQRAAHTRKVHNEAWRTVFELSRYARQGTLPLYPYGRVEGASQIPPATVWLIYPLYPASKETSRGRGLVELTNSIMLEAVADITTFREAIKADHRPLPPMGRPLKYPDYFYAAKAFWEANRWKLKSGAIIEHIREHHPELHAEVPPATRYRLVEKARVEAHKVA